MEGLSVRLVVRKTLGVLATPQAYLPLVIAVVELAANLAAQISKTCEFWQSVQEAPQDIFDIIIDLDLLSSVLTGIARSEQQHGGPPDPITIRILERCTEKVSSLRVIVDEFEAGFQSQNQIRKRWSACKVVLKKEKLRKLRQSLMETKATLALAQTDRQRHTTGLHLNRLCWQQNQVVTSTSSAQVYVSKPQSQPDISNICNGLQNLQVQLSTISTAISSIPEDVHKALEDKIRHSASELPSPILRASLLSSTKDAPPQITHSMRESFKLREKMPIDSSNSLSRNIFGTTYFTTRTERRFIYVEDARTEEYETVSSIVFHPAAWLLKLGLRSGIEVAARHSSKGWQHTISSIRAVPDDSLIFQFCKSGNLEGVRGLFAAGKASVQDSNSRGDTPLHYSTRNMHIELSKFLIQNGADGRALSYHRPQFAFVSTPACEIDLFHDDAEAMLLLFEAHIDFCEQNSGYDAGWQLLSSLESDKRPPCLHSNVAWLCRKYHIEKTGHFDSSSTAYALRCAIWHCADLEIVRLILEFDPNLINNPGHFPFHGRPLIHGLVDSCCAFNVQKDELFELLINKGANLHQIFQNETPTSESMQFPGLFGQWRDLLRGRPQEQLETLLQHETSTLGLPLERDNWCPHTLQDLFDLPLVPEFEIFQENWLDAKNLRGLCIQCSDGWAAAVVDPWWEELKIRIKRKECICGMLADHREWEFVKLELKGTSSDDQERFDVCGRTEQGQGDTCMSLASGEPLNTPSRTHRQLGISELRSLCRCCREATCFTVASNPQSDEDTTAIYSVEGPSVLWKHANLEESETSEENELSSTQSDESETLDQKTILRAMTLLYFRAQHGRWKNRYFPGELYCFGCLAAREGWTWEDSDEESGSQKGEEVTYAMPGTFVE